MPLAIELEHSAAVEAPTAALLEHFAPPPWNLLRFGTGFAHSWQVLFGPQSFLLHGWGVRRLAGSQGSGSTKQAPSVAQGLVLVGRHGQLHGAVKAADRSKDKSAFAKGNALMQDLSESGRKVLGSKVPDSGTPTRLMTAAAGGGLGAILAPKAVVAAAAPMVAYTPLGQRIIAELLTQRPASAEALAEGVRLLGPYMATLGASTGQKIGQ